MDERRMNQDGAVAGVNGDEFQPYECFQAAGGGKPFWGPVVVAVRSSAYRSHERC